MIKNNYDDRNVKRRKGRFSIRKYKVGVVSVAIGFTIFFGNQVASADEVGSETLVTESKSTDPKIESRSVDASSYTHEAQPVSDKGDSQTQNDVGPTEVDGVNEGAEDKKTDVASSAQMNNSSSEKVETSSNSEITDGSPQKNNSTQGEPVNENVEIDDKNQSDSVASGRPSEGEMVDEKSEVVDEGSTSETSVEDVYDKFKKLSPEEIKKLSVDDFKKINITPEFLEELTYEQIKAITFSKAYQTSVLSEDVLKKDGFRADIDTAKKEIVVRTAEEFDLAMREGDYEVIKIAANIDLSDPVVAGVQVRDPKQYASRPRGMRYKRNIVIESVDQTKYKLDFNTFYYGMGTDNSVTFRNLDLYGRSYYGLVNSAGEYNFENINFSGSQMVFSNRKSTINFIGEVNAQTVNKYNNGMYGGDFYVQERLNDSSPDNKQQIIEIYTAGSSVVFKQGSTVNFTTVSGNVIDLGANTSMIVESGAVVNLNPHSGNNFEKPAGGVTHAILLNGSGALIDVQKGGSLNINLEKTGTDQAVAGGIYISGGATLNVADEANLLVKSTGKFSGTDGQAGPIYLNGASKIDIGKDSNFRIEAEGLEDYSGSLLTINGAGNVDLDTGASFDIIADGSGNLTAISMSNEGKFKSDQPDRFNIDLSKNTGSPVRMNNGTINFTRVKQLFDDGDFSAPMKDINAVFTNGVLRIDENNGINSVTKEDEEKIIANAKSSKILYLTYSGTDVTLDKDSVKIEGNNKLSGKVTVEGGKSENASVSVKIT